MVRRAILIHPEGEVMASQEGLLPFKLIEDDSGEALTSFGGLPLVVETCQALGLPGLVKRHVRIKRRDIGYTESKYMESVIALIPAGGDCLEDIEQLQSDAVLKLLLGDRGYGRGVRRSKGKRDLEVTSEQAPGLLGSQIS